MPAANKAGSAQLANENISNLRLKSWRLIHEVSGYVVGERLRQVQVMLVKYSPEQPRVPAGSENGGQWTSGGVGSTLNASEPTPDQVVSGSEVTYPNGAPVINPNTGLPYPKPNGFDIQANIDFAKEYMRVNNSPLARVLIMINLFRAGGSYDYQRPEGLIPTMMNHETFKDDYVDVTNYNYGVVSAAFGYSKEDALLAAGAYNRTVGNTSYENITKYGIVQESVNNISQGHDDYYKRYGK